MYQLFPTKSFLRKAKKAIDTKSKHLHFRRALSSLEKNPFAKTLGTHKVQSRKYGKMYSSKVTGDLRIIWNFDEDDNLLLLLLDIGGHEGKRVYK